MLFTINANDGLPIYRQIVRQVKHAVASGKLSPGDQLPSQRDLSSELVINHLTVKKAYEVLEAEGLIGHRARPRDLCGGRRPRRPARQGCAPTSKSRARDLADAAQLLDLDFRDYRKITDEAWGESQKGNRT